VAEANMMGMAAGLAMSGLRPGLVYTITPSSPIDAWTDSHRRLCYHHVRLSSSGTGSGTSYASLGATHHSCEENGHAAIAPRPFVVAPADEWK